MDTIRNRYPDLIRRLVREIPPEGPVTEDKVYQEGISAALPFLDTIIKDYLEDGSKIVGLEHLEALAQRAEKGESCLILMEHYSNFDLPIFHYLLRAAGPVGQRIADALVAIAGIKLSESNPAVHAFARAYTRIVIYPSRSVEIIKTKFKDPKEMYHEIRRSLSINRAAMRELNRVKASGKIVLVFPAGTRFRPWDPASKRGVREIASYIKSFDKFCLVSINGNILRINPSGEMEDDILERDRVIYKASPVHNSGEFLAAVKYDLHFRDDKKQAIADTIMDMLDAMHREVEQEMAEGRSSQ